MLVVKPTFPPQKTSAHFLMEPSLWPVQKKTDEPREKPGLTCHKFLVSSATVSFNSLHVGFWLCHSVSTQKRPSYCMENSTGFYGSCFWPQGPYFVDTRRKVPFWKPPHPSNQKTYKLSLTSIPKNEWPGTPGQSAFQAPWWDWRKPQDSTCLVIDCVFCWLPNSHAPKLVTVWPLICWRGIVTPDLAHPWKMVLWLWQSDDSYFPLAW